ncbi:hypothetical protein E3C22_16665 [Jiella endophytica]|uniref:Uncharacterized protein n=1 Tax=Jiella endophytica TaxID=2558362 RepID=A0A4Y8RGF1_9HYPH|nr:hypothetical protein [Jiella endophytica]TFF20540.1 hypothetical protein E3C22_16665 [Jiella endophytica]
MPVREGGRFVRDPKSGTEKREGGTRQDLNEAEIPKGHPAEARLAEIADDQSGTAEVEPPVSEPPKTKGGPPAGTKGKD